MKRTPEYTAWLNMKNRCYNPNYAKYRRYGGRGIRVCTEWLASYDAFLEDVGMRPSSHHSLDRKDVNGNYEPSNCKWATKIEQANNRSNNHYVEHEGERLSVAAWARRLGIAPEVLGWYVWEGKTIADVLTLQQRLNSDLYRV